MSFYRQVHGVKDYTACSRNVGSPQCREGLREVALRRGEAGGKK